MFLFRLRFPGLSPSFRPGFPCLLSGSVYSAFCQFPFALLCFAPTAVPQMIAWLCSPFGSLRFSAFPFFSAFFRQLLFRFLLLGFRFFFSLLPFPASRLPFRCFFILGPFRLFPCFRSRFGTQPSCNSFLRSLFRLTSATSAADLLFPARSLPLAYALGSGYLARVMHPQN